jgi:hypothetical protein
LIITCSSNVSGDRVTVTFRVAVSIEVMVAVMAGRFRL